VRLQGLHYHQGLRRLQGQGVVRLQGLHYHQGLRRLQGQGVVRLQGPHQLLLLLPVLLLLRLPDDASLLMRL
jgi:hypothetical protein